MGLTVVRGDKAEKKGVGAGVGPDWSMIFSNITRRLMVRVLTLRLRPGLGLALPGLQGLEVGLAVVRGEVQRLPLHIYKGGER